MYIAFLILWIVFNGRLTLEVLLVGMVVCAALYLLCWKFMGYSVKQDIRLFKRLPLAFQYVIILIIEILKANKQVLYFITTPRYQVEPQIIHFQSSLKSELGRVILANSITLTPGTITVGLEGNDFYVHCLDKEFAEGIESSIFVELLEKMEAID